MKKEYIALFDSGIGGLSTLCSMLSVMPNEKYIYFGDNKNAPYGNRTKQNLLDLATKSADYLVSCGAKIIVLACNTLSTVVLENLKRLINVPVFGVFPPIESAIVSGKKTLLLATPQTAARFTSYEKSGNFYSVALDNLAKEIENKAFSLETLDINQVLSDALFRRGLTKEDKNGGFNTIILGCTHYSFVKNKIFDHFKPKTILNGNDFTAAKVKSFVKSEKSSVNNKGFEVEFVGKNADFNKNFFEKVVKRGLNFL